MANVLLCFLVCVALAAADYDCVCNYNVEEVVRGAPSATATAIGYMYEFDCKEHIPTASLGSSWFAVAYEHHIGYVQASGGIQIQTCQGSPPAEDRVTTTTSTTAAATTATTLTTTSAKPATTTPKPTATTHKPTTTRPATTTTTTLKPTTATPTPTTITTTTPKPTTTTTKTPRPITTTTTTPKPTTTTPKPTTVTPIPTTTTTTTPKPTTVTPIPTTTTTTHKPTTTTTTTLKPTTTTTTTPRPTTTTTTTLRPTTTTTTTPRPTTTTTTTLKPTTTITTTPRPTTTTSTTPKPTTTTSKRTTTLPSYGSPCYNTYLQYSRKIKGTLTSYGNNCYEFVTDKLTWNASETDCNTKGGHLVHIANEREQNYIYNFLKSHHNHRVWIGLHDHQTEEQFQWTSGDPITYTHWSISRYNVLLHVIQDCVELDPDDSGFWKDKICSSIIQQHYGYVCQYGGSSFTHAPITHAPITHAPVTYAPATNTPVAYHSGSDGNTHMCSLRQRNHAQMHGTILAQYGNSCYELMPAQRMTWQHAEALCQNGGGHLAHIRNAAEQTFIQGFMQRHSPDHAAWIGLHDLMYEGHYQWSSGAWVTYTNFVAGHLNNFANRNVENCFAIIPYKGGKWDDIPCGSINFFGQDYGEIHPMLCQFPIATASLIG